MTNSNFRVIAKALHPHFPGDLDALLDATEAVLNVLPPNVVTLTEHDKRVLWVLNDRECIDLVLDSRKILAIKRVRTELGCGLREAKDAIEDPRVPNAPLPPF